MDNSNVMNDTVKDALPAGENMYVYYSAYKFSKTTDEPLNNLKQVAVRGKVMFIQEHDGDDFWGKGETYQSPVVENPTWLDVAVLSNKMIQTVGDHHHIFLEGVSSRGTKTPNGVKVYEFDMGS